MKKLFITAVLLVSMMSNAQGKVYNLDAKKDSISSVQSKGRLTGDVAIYNGARYFVYESAKGKLYILVTSKKSGKQYKKYIG